MKKSLRLLQFHKIPWPDLLAPGERLTLTAVTCAVLVATCSEEEDNDTEDRASLVGDCQRRLLQSLAVITGGSYANASEDLPPAAAQTTKPSAAARAVAKVPVPIILNHF